MAQQASVLRVDVENVAASVQQFNTIASGYASIVSTSHEIVYPVEDFDPDAVVAMVNRPDRDGSYARKLRNFDDELGKLYRQILQIRTRTTEYPAKAVLPVIRQAYDVLMRKLVSDDEVRAQPNWQPVDPQEPRTVTRRQRLEYAIEKHIDDVRQRATLHSSTDHVLAIYKNLNTLFHTEKPIDVARARAISQAMLEVLDQWADALSLQLP